MKARATLLIAISAFIAAVGCAPGAGAEVPPEPPAPSDATVRVFPTSTPWPQFGPPPVTADMIATVEATPFVPLDVDVTPTAPGIPGGSGAASDAPGAVSASPTPIPSATPLDDSATFDPLLSYSYPVPLDWTEVVGDDEIVLVHSSQQANVSVRERPIDRSLFESLADVARSQTPVEFTDWAERSLSDARVTGDSSYRQEYVGTKLGEPYVAVVDWFLWGELIVEIVTEAEATVWAQNTNLHNTASLIASSLSPDPGAGLATAAEVEDQLRILFTQRPSNIYVDQDNGSAPTQLSCRQVLLDLLSEPVYISSGVWQVFAVTGKGAQVWEIFEPGLSVRPAPHNTSTC